MARGGYRPGAGRPKGAKSKDVKPRKAGEGVPKDIAAAAEAEGMSPLDYMLKVMRDRKAAKLRRDRMAIAAAPFVHPRKGEGKGKKEERDGKAKTAGDGKFAAGRPPLKVVK